MPQPHETMSAPEFALWEREDCGTRVDESGSALADEFNDCRNPRAKAKEAPAVLSGNAPQDVPMAASSPIAGAFHPCLNTWAPTKSNESHSDSGSQEAYLPKVVTINNSVTLKNDSSSSANDRPGDTPKLAKTCFEPPDLKILDDEPSEVTVPGEHGSKLRYGADGRIRGMQDAAGRQFEFGYDKNSGVLNYVHNEHGHWHRRRAGDPREGRYSDTWVREGDKYEWTGEVRVNERAYGYRNKSRQTIYLTDGTKMRDALSDGQTYFQTRMDRNGNRWARDLRTGITVQKNADGTMTIWNGKDKSQMDFDGARHLTHMKDGRGREFFFSNYDADGKPQQITEGKTVWKRSGDSTWFCPQNGRYRYGNAEIQKDQHGRFNYSFTEWSGRRTTHSSDGNSTIEYGGIITRNDRNDLNSMEFADGKKIEGGPFAAGPKFKVDCTKGRTIDVSFGKGDVSVVRTRDDVHADFRLNENQAVAAFQDGLVVFSSRPRDKGDQRAHSVIGLSAQAQQVLDNYRSLSPGDSEIVMVQCYDKKTGGVRYEIYSGFSECNVATGDRVEAGSTVLGRIGKGRELHYGVRRNAPHGEPIEIAMK
ncbi:MAG TPA: hypothetical protein V6D17_05615 [Candidatus Obscuribacterales bacterium]